MNTQVLEHGQITIQRIFPAKAANKSATIRDMDGQMFSIWPTNLGIYREGETYDIEFTSNEKNGVVYRDIKRGTLAARPSPAGPNIVTGAQVREFASPPPKPQGKPMDGSNFYKPTSPKDARRMFICSQMNALIQSRQIVPLNSQTIADHIAMLAEAYDATIGQEDVS
jgi:hypothetical protein